MSDVLTWLAGDGFRGQYNLLIALQKRLLGSRLEILAQHVAREPDPSQSKYLLVLFPPDFDLDLDLPALFL